jgi:hypothetical protein
MGGTREWSDSEDVRKIAVRWESTAERVTIRITRSNWEGASKGCLRTVGDHYS